MPSSLAQIASGATAGSTSVVVNLSAGNGTTVLVYRGEMQIGSAALLTGSATVALSSALGAGDIIQASVSEKGNQCGTPVQVKATNIRLSGWKTPSEVFVELLNGTFITLSPEQFFADYGYLPASLYDPVGLNTSVPTEYEPAPTANISFDVAIEKQNGQTTVTVYNVQNIKGGAVIRWNGGSWGNSISQSFVSAAAITVDVRGGDDVSTNFARKSLDITILALPVTPASDADLKQWAYCYYEGNVLRVMLNARVAAQARIDAGPWQDFIPYQLDYYDTIFGGVNDGSHTVNIRKTGEANTALWVNMTFIKG